MTVRLISVSGGRSQPVGTERHPRAHGDDLVPRTMDDLLHEADGRDHRFALARARRQVEGLAEERRVEREPLADQLQRDLGRRRAINGLPQSEGEDLGIARDVESAELFRDHLERVLPVLEAHGGVVRGDGNRVADVVERIQTL